MDLLDTDEEVEGEEEEEGEEKKKVEVKKREGFLYIFLRCSLLIFVSILVTFSLPIFGLIIEVLLGNISNWNPISVPSKCKIVSSSVDLRSSKVCELGLLNYKSKHVFYSSERKQFRCHYDYYWASVFEVEYLDHSGWQQLAFAEAPTEALPPNCRPNFGAAWLTKDKFKVNETYNCWYTVGLSKVDLDTDALFNCLAKDPSIVEMLKRCFFLSMRIAKSDIFTGGSSHWKWNVAAGVLVGFSTSLLSFSMVGLLWRQLKYFLHRLSTVNMHSLYQKAVILRRICFFVAYFSFMSWLALQYIKWFGFPDILKDDYSW